MKNIQRQVLTGERALFKAQDLNIVECTFEDGESPLKESSNVTLTASLFKWKYPLWYTNNATLNDCVLFADARAGIWYTNRVTVKGGVIEAPKAFRRSTDITLIDLAMPNASETLWNCEGITVKNVTANGNYLGMGCKNIVADGFTLTGDYCFDGVKNAAFKNCKLISKDAFWNSKNVVITDSFISGEYFGWNSENVTLVNCTVESLQGFCYIKNLKMINCRLINTDRAFEYSTVDVEIVGSVDSITNPLGGKIVADGVGELIRNDPEVDLTKTEIIIGGKKV